MKTRLLFGAAALLAVALHGGPAVARDQLRIVGSSTVFPFAASVAENFGQKTSFKTPVVESTGSGGGMKLFCAGIGESTPDIANTSRRIKESELEKCRSNGVTPVEVRIGFDGIVLANSRSGADMHLTLKQIFMALARTVPVDGRLVPNPYVKWSDIDASLPNRRIEVLGPPPTSGTRDAFVELAMEGGARRFAMLKALREKDEKKFRAIAHGLREDGSYVEAGENDNLIVQKLEANPDAVGIFGFSFLDQNADRIKGATIEGTEPTFENIADGAYPISRSLYFYIKKEHVGIIPGIREYVAEFTSEGAWGDEGYLADIGLIPLPGDDRKVSAEAARTLKRLEM